MLEGSNAKELITPKNGDIFIFSIADGTVKLSGREYGIRKSTLTRDRPGKSEDIRGDLQGNSEKSQPIDETKDDAEARKDFWSIGGNYIYRPRVQLYVPKEETFPIPQRSIDVVRTTHTTLDVLQESRIDHYRNVDVDRSLSDSWTGFTKFTTLNEKPLDGYVWSGRRLAKTPATTRPDHL